ncbi:MAG TPA: hypothetical protein ENJ51_04195 [Leucothrix mucor]|uniref:Uncharacterized protein n=1 Tax=Leucothrix mucor TaxID=45248 RepID=A0A7V2T247_LEUMU|nr:hypothetical protein [Leucothrix mucor]
MQLLLNRLINFLKWPIGILSILLFMPACSHLWQVMGYIYKHSSNYSMLFYGFFAYSILWLLWIKQSMMARWFSTLEHEVTHSIFAIISLNRVVGLHATGGAGGVMYYHGPSNWIITLSPYFVPTLSLFILLFLSLVKTSHLSILFFLLGFSLAYNFLTMWKSIHYLQSDLVQSGWLFVCMFLPTANVLMLLIILTALPNDGLNTENSLLYVWQDAMVFMEYYF